MGVPSPERNWLTEAEAAQTLGVTTRSVRNYVARGVLPASRIRNGRPGRGPIRFRRSDVEALLEPIPTAVSA